MYQVYSQQRPGRPRWALGSSAILLLMTVGLAYALVEYKAHGGVEVLRGGLRISLPYGWKETHQHEVPADTVLAAERPDVPDNRMLLVFSGELRGRRSNTPAGFAGSYCRRAVETVLPIRAEYRVDALPGSDRERIAGREATTIRLRSFSSPPVYCLARVAEVEPRKVIGVVVLAVGDLQTSDARLLDRVSERIEVVAPDSTPAE